MMNPNARSSRFQRRSLTVAAASLASMAAVPSATNADIVYSGPLNQSVTNTPYVFAGVIGDPNIIVLADKRPRVMTIDMQIVGNSLVALNLPANTIIDSSRSFPTNIFTDSDTTPLTSTWDANQTGYVGFQVPNGSDFNYGWIEMSTGADRILDVTILGWAYESTLNAAIQTGAIPEPATCLLSIGGTMLMFLRRRRMPAGGVA